MSDIGEAGTGAGTGAGVGDDDAEEDGITTNGAPVSRLTPLPSPPHATTANASTVTECRRPFLISIATL